VQLKKGFYAPKGHADLEIDQFMLRKSLIELLQGQRPMPVEAVS
jgi:hypothetical protein